MTKEIEVLLFEIDIAAEVETIHIIKKNISITIITKKAMLLVFT